MRDKLTAPHGGSADRNAVATVAPTPVIDGATALTDIVRERMRGIADASHAGSHDLSNLMLAIEARTAGSEEEAPDAVATEVRRLVRAMRLVSQTSGPGRAVRNFPIGDWWRGAGAFACQLASIRPPTLRVRDPRDRLTTVRVCEVSLTRLLLSVLLSAGTEPTGRRPDKASVSLWRERASGRLMFRLVLLFRRCDAGVGIDPEWLEDATLAAEHLLAECDIGGELSVRSAGGRCAMRLRLAIPIAQEKQGRALAGVVGSGAEPREAAMVTIVDPRLRAEVAMHLSSAGFEVWTDPEVSPAKPIAIWVACNSGFVNILSNAESRAAAKVVFAGVEDVNLPEGWVRLSRNNPRHGLGGFLRTLQTQRE